MAFIAWVLFESAAALAAVLGVTLFILLVYWRRSGRGRPLLIGLAVAILLFVVQALVVTPREHVGRTLTAIETDIVRARTDALADALAADFDAAGMNRDAFIAYVGRQMQKVDVHYVDRRSLHVEDADGDRVRGTAEYLADVTVRDYADRLPTRWSLTFVRTADGWKIVTIEPLSIAGIDRPSWNEIDRH
jgi:hypothetical protein